MGVHMLALLFDFSPLKITYLLAMPVAGLWVGVDSEMRIGNGWLWGSLAFACPFIGVPVYYGLLLVQGLSAERRNRDYDGERERIKEQSRKFKMMGEIERQQYLDGAERSGGTVFGAAPEAMRLGAQRFTDQRVEELLSLRKHGEAQVYLEDMLALAVETGDVEREQTYRYYLGRLTRG
jgi:hypothetical protein